MSDIGALFMVLVISAAFLAVLHYAGKEDAR
jgi:hypothetical protein